MHEMSRCLYSNKCRLETKKDGLVQNKLVPHLKDPIEYQLYSEFIAHNYYKKKSIDSF